MTEGQGRNNETKAKEGSYSYPHSGLPRTYAPEMHNSRVTFVETREQKEKEG